MESFVLMTTAVICFHAAYTPLQQHAWGWFILGYAICVTTLTHQKTVRCAFYFGLATGCLCVAPQMVCLWDIFKSAAIVLWLVLAFWIGLFAALVCACTLRWGRTKTLWLVPVIWTGLEYFRSELYYLRFSWLNIGYILPVPAGFFGTYATGFLVFCIPPVILSWRSLKLSFTRTPLLLGFAFVLLAFVLPMFARSRSTAPSSIMIAGIQMEFPPENILPKALNKAMATNPDAQIFVLSEYTLHGPVPESLKQWCREHSHYLVVGGEDPAGTDNYYDTAFVVGTNGTIVFKQAKSVPIQFFQDGLPAKKQEVWDSPWGKIGFCICYDLSYTRVTDALVKQGAQLLIVPTMDVSDWGRHEHEMHTLVAPVRAAEYGIPIFRLASSGISQAVQCDGTIVARTSFPGSGEVLSAKLRLPAKGTLPLDRLLGPCCVMITATTLIFLAGLSLRERSPKNKSSS